MNKTFYDIAVIGGGASGMMASGCAAEKGANVILLEKNSRLGQKLYLTGKGRCNITNKNFYEKDLIKIFGKNGAFLYSAFRRFNVESTLNFFNSRGLKTKVERGNRVFPASDKAQDVINVLENFLYKNKVTIKTNSSVKNIIKQNDRIKKIVLKDEEICADKYILCTGGLSYAHTGSTGEGLGWAKKLGHTIVSLKPALTPLLLKERWIKQLQGISLRNIEISVVLDKKIADYFGEALFTSEGISGPIILDMSKLVTESMQKGQVKLCIDMKPALQENVLDKRIQRDFKENLNKSFKNSLNKLLPKKLIPVIITLSKIPPEKKVNSITRQERLYLVKLLKNLQVTVAGSLGFEKAVITSGGVFLKEVNPKTMKSKIIDNLYFAGEILDLDGPTGGYNLQVCWTTGYIAGQCGG